MQVRQAVFAAMLMASTVACGGRGVSSPSAPSSLSGPAALTGATVQGQVQSGTAMLAATTGAAASGLTVTVVGTTISTTVSGTGQFVLNGVPAGSSQLNFSGPGVNVTVTFAAVQGTETISITVKISGNQAEVESEEHDNHGDLEIHGNISGLTGSAASFSFMVGGKTVHGDAQTSFFGDGDRADSFATLHDGARVEVKGAMREGLVYAQRIHINGSNGTDNDDNDNEADEVEATGKISIVGGTAPNLTLTLSNGTIVKTSSSTTIRRKDESLTFSALTVGIEIEVEGALNPDGSIAAKKIQIEDNGDDHNGDQSAEAEASGTIGSLTPGCPSISFMVSGTPVTTNSSTEFKGVSCSALKNGDKVKVEGTKQSSGAILAKEVKKQ